MVAAGTIAGIAVEFEAVVEAEVHTVAVRRLESSMLDAVEALEE